MKQIKRILMFILVLTIIVSPLTALAHGGRTDSNGGHKDNKNKSGLGYYHYHCGGNPPHLHDGGVCPYSSVTVSSASQSKTSSEPTEVYASSVEISEKPTNLDLGEEFNIKYSVYPDSAINKDITWSSSDESIALVDSEGLVTTHGIGTTVITATTSNDKTTSFELTVNEVIAESLNIKDKPTNMTNAKKIPLYVNLLPKNTTSKEIEWTSSDPSVAEVNESGNLKALSPGTVTITATQKNISDSFELIVEPIIPSSIEIASDIDKHRVGDVLNLEAVLLPKNADDKTITWSVDNEELATIEGSVLTTKRPGTVIVTATTVNNKTDSIELEILPGIEAVFGVGAVVIGGIFTINEFVHKKKGV